MSALRCALIETSEEEAYVAVAKYIAELRDGQQSTFTDECEQLYAAEQHEKLLDKFMSALDAVFAAASSDADLECCLNMMCHLVPRIPLPAATAAAQRLAAALAASTDSRPDKRLLALVTLYNAAYDAPTKAAVLLQALGYAKAAGLSDTMLPVIRAHADSWPTELGLDAAGERRLFTACADALEGCTRKPRTAAREGVRLLSKCLVTYEDAPAAELPTAVPAAAHVVAEFVRSPDVFQFDLATNPAVAQLSSVKEHAPLHRLLSIFLKGSVQDYQAFVATADGTAALAAAGISGEEALAKMRLLAFMGLAHGATEVTFGQIQAALDLSAEEVEGAVVQAIGKRIAEARIDQLRGVVAVSKCAPRTFGPQHWLELQTTLAGWKEAAIMAQQAVAEAGGSAPARSGPSAAPAPAAVRA
ncbi:Eukaryotic translation initiation factor 3 subunit M [Micractinium conductrix]|uniref:Eukaryotic translation initiation factor 3 subunit M n=1 Tax=Micractinium conductrix TaxID=554055 RepID=A0A2P6VJX0_9CHLO|nr:Eukaryotic translation initiation factor 3 subunit M [Micractinium conductrix]|eukprot:PSC74383.1 Eukaryotic translation initiation factor 3 subunit M [Micractinium conductrix]